jgi:hypothetical protein
MKFTQINPKPSDRSIFRKNIGRALLNKRRDFDYLTIWEIDFTSSINRTNHSHLRNIEKKRILNRKLPNYYANSSISVQFPLRVRKSEWERLVLRAD